MQLNLRFWTAAAIAAVAIIGLGSSSFAQDSAAVKVGDKAPDFELEGLDGKTVKLSSRFGENGKPVVLLFSRANW